jgi:hypothetical protein
MAFSLFVEMLNLRMRSSKSLEPVKLRVPYAQEVSAESAGE